MCINTRNFVVLALLAQHHIFDANRLFEAHFFLPGLEKMPKKGQTVVCNLSGTCVKGAYKPVGDKSAHQRLAKAAGMSKPAIGASIKPNGTVGLRSESINRYVVVKAEYVVGRGNNCQPFSFPKCMYCMHKETDYLGSYQLAFSMHTTQTRKNHGRCNMSGTKLGAKVKAKIEKGDVIPVRAYKEKKGR